MQRKQYVVVEGVKSTYEPVLFGVPQGSVIGPLLLIVMLRDIDCDVKSASVSSFADDTRVTAGISTRENVADLQDDLERIYLWAVENNASFNSNKFECVRYGCDKSLKDITEYYTSDHTVIESMSSVKDLGVTMSADGSFSQHIADTARSANMKSAWILRSFKTRERSPLITLWKSLVRPTFEYCCQLWCQNSPGLI